LLAHPDCNITNTCCTTFMICVGLERPENQHTRMLTSLRLQALTTQLRSLHAAEVRTGVHAHANSCAY
jgi:hypothetical protein